MYRVSRITLLSDPQRCVASKKRNEDRQDTTSSLFASNWKGTQEKRPPTL